MNDLTFDVKKREQENIRTIYATNEALSMQCIRYHQALFLLIDAT